MVEAQVVQVRRQRKISRVNLPLIVHGDGEMVVLLIFDGKGEGEGASSRGL
jgi:hypothetical protein